ncbi:MAG: hypothetical protein IPP08_06680 [Chlorobiota bacterium]|nr:MAG: hypothetical protein IPP08_06680 [Chlorobiota bacterium]
MIIIKTPILKLLILGILFSVINTFSNAKENFYSLIENQSDNSIIFSFKNFHSVIKNDKSLFYLDNNAPLNSTFKIDSNTLNNLNFTFCIPLNAININAELIKSNIDTIYLKHKFNIDNKILIVAKPYLQRGIRLVSVKLNPYKYFESGILNMNSGIIKLSWDLVQSKNKYSLIEESKSVEEFFSSFVMNYKISKSWQLESLSNNNLQSKIENFGIGESIIMLTPNDGIYNISGKDAIDLGANNIIGKLFSEIRIKNKEKLIPFYIVDKDSNNSFDLNDEIEFYGSRNNDNDSLYYSDITDTNAYILTWNGGLKNIKNIKLVSQSNLIFKPIEYQDTTLHFEKNNISFLGHTLNINEGGDVRTIHNNNRVKGERYYWGKFSKPGDVIFTIPFECYPSFANNQKIKISTRLLGNSLRQSHNLTFRLNGKNFKDRFHINIYSDTLIEFYADQNYFIQGKNTLLILIDDTLSDINNELYFDYLELNGKFSGVNNSNKLYLTENKNSIKIPLFLDTQESNIVFSEKEKIEVKDIKRGSHYNITSRQMVGDDRQLPGFVFQSKDTTISSLPYQLGIMAIEINGFDGSILRTDRFDLYGSNANNEALRCSDFIKSSQDSNYLILGTSVGSGRFAKSVLKNQFQRIGVTKLIDPKVDDFVCSWIYGVKIGDISTSQEYFSTIEDSNQGLGKKIFFENKLGNSFLGVLNLDSISSSSFNISKIIKPKFLYSKKDILLEPRQADMIIISHSNFIESAIKLANYRTTINGIKTLVINVQDIYNEFNFGIKSNIAIRKYTDYIFKNYQSPKPAYLLLFGDASWDVSMSLPNSVKTDFVPSNGRPVSDYLYSVALEDSINFTPNYFVGRLPVDNVIEAEAIVSKLIEYDTLPPAWWNKRYLFVAGGTSEKQVSDERSRDKNLAELVLNNNYQGDTAFVFRTEKDPILQFPTTTDGYWVRDEVNKGCLHWSFSGHGSINNIDLDFGNAEDFNNVNKYFIVSSFSCQTGDFSDPVVDSRTERMIKIANKGAIAAIGNTSYSYTVVDNDLKRNFYEYICSIPLDRYLGHIFTKSKYPIYEKY